MERQRRSLMASMNELIDQQFTTSNVSPSKDKAGNPVMPMGSLIDQHFDQAPYHQHKVSYPDLSGDALKNNGTGNAPPPVPNAPKAPQKFKTMVINGAPLTIADEEPDKPNMLTRVMNYVDEQSTDVLRGLREMTTGFLGQIYDASTSGNPNDIVRLMSPMVTGGILGVDPEKGITEGGLTSNTGAKLIDAGKDFLRGDNIGALSNVAKAVPYIGPLAEMISQSLEEGKFGKAIGQGIGIYAGGKIVEAAKPTIVNAAVRLADRINAETVDPKPLIDHAEKLPEGPEKAAAVQVVNQTLENNKKITEEATKSVATDVIVNHEIKATAKKVKEIKKAARTGMRAGTRGTRKPIKIEGIQPILQVEETPSKFTPEPTPATPTKPDFSGKGGMRARDRVKKTEPTPSVESTPETDFLTGEVKPAKSMTELLDEIEKEEVPLKNDETIPEGTEFDAGMPPEIMRSRTNQLFDELTGKEDGLSEIEQFYGKTKDKITDEEWDSWIDKVTAEDAPEVKDLDFNTGTELPKELVGEESIFSTDKETTREQTKAYAQSKSVAGSFAELKNQDPTKPMKDPGTTLWKLTNDVNRWIHGDRNIDIEQTRNFISEIATRYNEFKDQMGFDPEQAELASDVANWARKAEQAKAKDVGTSLYSGLPLDKIYEEGKRIYNNIRNSERKAESIGKVPRAEVFRIIKENAKHRWISQGANTRSMLEAYGQKTYKLIQVNAAVLGGGTRARENWHQAMKESFSGLSSKEKSLAHRLIMAERVIAIDKTPSGVYVKYPEAYSVKDSQLLSANIGKKEFNGYKDLSLKEESKIRNSVRSYFDWYKKAVNDGFEAGIISEKERNALIANDYFPFSRVKEPVLEDIFDKSHTGSDLKGKPTKIYDSGIESMTKGKPSNIFNPNADEVMLEFFNRFYNRIQINEAKTEGLRFAREDPKNPFIRIKDSNSEVLPEQPTKERGLRDSIRIKRDEQGLSDYEYKQFLKENFKVTTSKRMTIDQLQKLDKLLGEQSKAYAKVAKADRIPKGWIPDNVFEGGGRKRIYIEPKFAKEWMRQTPEITSTAARTMRILTGMSAMKAGATGIMAPLFALKNLPRDIVHSLFATREMVDGKWKTVYRITKPTTMFTYPKDIADVVGDAMFRRGSYLDYIDDGGGTKLLSIQGKMFNNSFKVDNTFDRIQNALTYLNETSEITTRLALRQHIIKARAKELGISIDEAMKNKDIRREATFIANDQMPFHERGSMMSIGDSMLSYLSASISGARAFYRMFKDPNTRTESMLKLAAFGTVVVGLYLANKQRSPETMKEVQNDPATAGYMIIPFGDSFSYKDDKNRTRHRFIKIPIDQNLVFFKTLFEASTDKVMGKDVDANYVMNILSNSSPTGMSSIAPTFQALWGYALNKNFWTQDDIFKGKTVPYSGPPILRKNEIPGSEVEYDQTTPKLYKDLGGVTGGSPDRLEYAIGSIISNDNYFSHLGLGAYEQAFGNLSDDQRQTLIEDMITKAVGVDKYVGITNPDKMLMKDAVEIENKETAIKQQRRVELDRRINDYLNGITKDRSEIGKYIATIKDPNVQDAMNTDVQFSIDTKDLPHRSWWLKIRRMSDEGRAEAYVERMKKASPEEVDRINQESNRFGDGPGQIKGIFTPGFIDKVYELQNKSH
jgi:hypothetical protein